MTFQQILFSVKYGLYRPQTAKAHREYASNQYLSKDELDQINWTKRKKILKHAYANIPFYRERWTSVGIHPDEIKKPEDYSQIPRLSKCDLKDHFDKLKDSSVQSKFLVVTATGGSTGMPVKVGHDSRLPLEAHGWRMLGWWGVKPYMNAAYVWRVGQANLGLKGILNSTLWWPTRRIRMDASNMQQSDVEEFILKFNLLNPPILQGYTGAIAHIASVVRQKNLWVKFPKAIWVTSSPVSKVQRQLIEEVFHAPVYDQYGSCEIPWISAQCAERKGLHINYESRFVEYLDQENKPVKQGVSGRIVITDLEDYVFPLIRYEIGDMGRELPDPCTCGVTLPMMDQVLGRTTDLVHLPNGSCISGDYLTTVFDDYPDAVRGFQVFQSADGKITIRYVPNPDDPRVRDIIKKVTYEIGKRVNSEVEVNAQALPEIPHDRGKLRFVISELDREGK